jgi:hypothetical protein
LVLTVLQLLKLSEDEMAAISRYHKKPGMHKTLCFPHLLRHDPLRGVVLSGWKLEWLGWAMNDQGEVTADDVDASPA